MAKQETTQEPEVKSRRNVAEGFQALLRWVDVNILPLIALPALAILAADDIRSHLAHVTDGAALAIAICLAAILAVKSYTK